MLFSKKLKYSILLALFCIVPFFLFAQKTNEELAKHLSKIKIDELVIGTLSEVLDRFEKRYEIPFSFDRKALNKIKINERPFEARFDTYLETTLSEHRLKYVLYEAKIYVIPKSNTLEQVMRKEAVRNTHNKDTNNKAITEQIFKNVVPKKFNFTITGRVKDAETGETLPFSTIMIKGTTQGVTANADGYFILQNVPTDTSTIVGQYMGYKDLTIRLLPHLSNENIVLDLMPSSAIDEVIIEGERENLMQSNPQDISVIRLTPRSLERLPNVGEKDIMRSFQLMPGVSASNESSSGLYVRGGTPDQNLIVYDGFTVYHVDHLYGFFSAFNSNALKDVQLHKGGFDSRFGGRLASVTEITGKDGNQKQFNMGGDVSLLSMNVFAELPIGDKFTSVFAYRRSYKGFLYNSIMDKFNQNSSSSTSNQAQPTSLPNTNQTKATSYFYDLNGKMTYRFSDNHSLAWSIYNGTDKLDNGYKIETPSFLASQGTNLDFSIGDLTRYGNVGTSLKWTQRWSPKFYGNVLLSYSNYYSNRDRTNNSTITLSSGETRKINFGTIEDNNLKDYSLKADYQYDIHPKHQLQFGAMLTNYDIKYSYSQNDTTTIISKDDQGKTYSFYLQNRMKFLDNKLQIIAGARTTYFDVTAQNYIEPRLNATYQLNKKITLKGAWGKYYQFANRVLREDILAGSRDFWVLSNGKNIPVSSSMHYIAGVSYDTRDYLLSVEGYYKSWKDFLNILCVLMVVD
jgi:ferric enterobactin receptor